MANMAHATSAIVAIRTAVNGPKLSLQYLRRAYSHFPLARRRRLLQSRRPSTVPTGVRSFTSKTRHRYADVESSIDFRQQDRESDEVDVCIVGGGIWSPKPWLLQLLISE